MYAFHSGRSFRHDSLPLPVDPSMSHEPQPEQQQTNPEQGDSALSGLLRRFSKPLSTIRARRSATLSLTLEGSSVRLLRSYEGAIQSWVSLPFNPRLMQGGRIEDPRGMAEVITNGISRLEGGDQPATIVTAFPSSQIFIRYVGVPRVRGVDPEIIVEREARRVLGSAADQQIFYSTQISSTPSAATYYLLAVSRIEMARFVETLQHCNLKPKRIDARPLALARAMPENDGVLLRLEATDLSVIAMVNRIPELVTRRSLEVSTSTNELIGEISDAVRTTVAYQASRTEKIKALSPDAPLFLFGGHPQIGEGIDAAIKAAVDREVRIPPSPRPAPADFPSHEYMANIGLTLTQSGQTAPPSET